LRPSKPTKRVVLFGNGGGTSVLATDYFTGLELDILPFDDTARLQLEALNLPPGTSVANPIDTPVRTLQEDEGRIANRILHIVYTLAAPEAVVMHLNLASFVGRGDVDPIDNLINAAIQVQETFPEQAHFVLVLRVDGSPELDEKMRRYREKALSVGIPVYDELAPAAKALKAVSMVEHRFSTRW
jgi:acyl-CoA synthetase (NDP forming)